MSATLRPALPLAATRPSGWRGRSSLTVLLGYAFVSFLYLGLRLLIEPGGRYIGFKSDPKAFIWCFGWWPHAILHGENPFVSHAIWAPSGINLIWTTSVPGLALLFSPVTVIAGPVVSYNLATVLLPAFAGWTSFLLFRHLTRSMWASLVGGYLFGFSSYVLGQEEGHPHMTAVFLLPLIALVCIRYLEGELSRRGVVVRLGPLFGLEFLFSTELTFTLGLAIATALVVGFALLPGRRRLVALVPLLAAAYAFAALLTAPFVYYALTGFSSSTVNPPAAFITDLANFAIPTHLAAASVGWADPIAHNFPGNDSEQDAYLGVPALLICLLWAWRGIRMPRGRFLFVVLAIGVVATMGATLTINGDPTIALPWRYIQGWPLFDNVIPERLTMYVSLVIALIVALWTAARPRGWLRLILPALAVIALIPNPKAGVWATGYSVPEFFTASDFQSCLDPGETILPLPVSSGAQSMLWQAVAGYRFAMAGGAIAPGIPPAFALPPAVGDVAAGETTPEVTTADIEAYIKAKGVTSVVVDGSDVSEWASALDPIATPQYLGGVVVYHISDGSPSCLGAA